MLYEIIDLFASIISTLIIGAGFIWIVLFIFKRLNQKKGDKKALKQIKDIELKLKNIGKGILRAFMMVVTMIFCTILAIAIKPIIYKLNFPLGEGYATFASYIVAICLWILLRPKTTAGGSQ